MARKKTVKGETTDLAQPQNRTEEFLAKIAGLVDTLPQGEFSRLERYLKYIAENGGGGGGGGVTSFNSRTGAVTPESGDYSEFFAPSGYGLGVANGKTINYTYDLDDLTTGFYSWTTSIPTHAPTADNQYCALTVLPRGAQICTSYSSGITQIRYKVNDTWSAWEYVNPPLAAGTEYRTTERFLGKPVYAYVQDCGTLAAGSNRIRCYALGSPAAIIRTCGAYYNISTGDFVGMIPQFDSASLTNANTCYVEYAQLNYIGVYAGSTVGNGSYKAYVTIYYTKTTD